MRSSTVAQRASSKSSFELPACCCIGAKLSVQTTVASTLVDARDRSCSYICSVLVHTAAAMPGALCRGTAVCGASYALQGVLAGSCTACPPQAGVALTSRLLQCCRHCCSKRARCDVRHCASAQVFMHSPDNETIEICNCDCLPVVPLTGELSGQRLSKEDLGGCRPRVDLASPEAVEQLSVQQRTLG